MALNGKGRVYDDCNYASNPYHECTDSCLKKIAEGKGKKDKKKSDRGNARREGELNKKYDENKVHPSCHKASNPYHECDDDCFKRIGVEPRRDIGKTGSIVAVPVKAGRRNKHESEPKSRQEVDNVSAQTKVYAPESPFLPSHFASAEKEVESDGEEHYASVPYSGEIHVDDDPRYNVKKVQAPQLVPTSGILAMTDKPEHSPKKAALSQPKESPVDKKKDKTLHALLEESRNPIMNDTKKVTSESINFTFSGISVAFEESDDDDAQSVVSDSSVSVGKYRVKERISSILQKIFENFGDIAASCKLESISMRSYYLECLCFVVHDLQSTSIKQLTKSKVKEMLAILKDVECAGIEVGWLRDVLNGSMEDIELVSQQRTIGAAKANCDRDIELLRKQLEAQMENLALKEEEVEKAKKQVAESKAHLKELEVKASDLDKTLGSIKSKVATLQNKAILDGVL